ncbi:ATP-binding protein [Spirillospora sp. CA-253888]
MRGLRARLVVVFVLVASAAALVASALAYRQARDLMLDRTQNAVLSDFRQQVSGLAFEIEFPPDRRTLETMAHGVKLAFREAGVAIRFHDLTATSLPVVDRIGIPAELRKAVREGRSLRFQRVVRHGEPWLVMGTPVTFDRDRAPSGLEAYAVVSLAREDADSDALIAAVAQGALPILGLSVVLALLAARGVLRPVRDLGRAARGLAAGRLDTRLRPRGSDELADLARTFNTTAEALESTVAELREREAAARRFVADVSHELRTPLAAMAAVSDVLDEDAAGLPPDTAAAARLVSAETGNLARLVDDLIEVSRFDAGAASLAPRRIDVADALRRTLRSRSWSDRIETDLPEGVDAVLDPRRLDVIIANLAGNALRHGAPPVRLRLRADEHALVVEVSDHGPGIPPEARPHVFDRFFKADAARTRSDGSGLGLAIAQENARLHGGEITLVDPPDGRGTVFVLRIPRRTVP